MCSVWTLDHPVYGSEIQPMKTQQKVTELKSVSGQKTEKFRKLLGLAPVISVTRKGKLNGFSDM